MLFLTSVYSYIQRKNEVRGWIVCLWTVWTAEVSVIWPVTLWLGLVPDGLLLWLLIVCSRSEPGRPVRPAGGGSHAQPAPGWGPGVCVPQQGQREWDLWAIGNMMHVYPVSLFELPVWTFLCCYYCLKCPFLSLPVFDFSPAMFVIVIPQ